MMDFFADNLIKKIIGEVITNKDTIKDDLNIWKSLTRQMFLNFGTNQVYYWIGESLEEASDEQWFEHKYPRGFFKEDWVYKDKKRKTVIKIDLKKSRTKKLINDNLKIIDIAKDYNIQVRNNKSLCPFHIDTNPSLIFYPVTNTFHCFGCKKSGDVVEFIRRMDNII